MGGGWMDGCKDGCVYVCVCIFARMHVLMQVCIPHAQVNIQDKRSRIYMYTYTCVHTCTLHFCIFMFTRSSSLTVIQDYAGM